MKTNRALFHLATYSLLAATTAIGCGDMDATELDEDVWESEESLLMAPSQAEADSTINSAYSTWKTKYVTSSGAGGFLRVQRPENANDTVSEGIAYGMLLAAYLADKPTFDGLWGYAKSHLDGNGLMHWQINASNSVIGWNAATDSDEDMALALIVAEKAWGATYGVEAKALLGRILQHEVESGTNVLKPGDAWGGSSVTNPSYFAPGYYRVFKAYTGEARWESVAASCYQIIANLNANTGAGTTGLLPDWTTAAGNPASGMGFDYRYDAARVPWRLAVDAVWYGTPQAIAQLDKLNTFWKSVGVGNIKDGYTVSGNLIGQWHNATFVGMAAAGAAVSPDAAFKTAMWNEIKNFQSENYYNDSLRVLALLFMGDRMPNPVGGSSPPPSQNAAPSVNVTAPSNGGSFSAPASISIQASANDSDGTVSKVEFFAGAVKLGEDTTAPYSYTWSNVAAGSYAITAKATDNAGATTTSSVVAVTVNDPGQPPPSGGGALSVQYRAGDTNASDNQIRPHLNIVNAGASSVPLSELKIRYWYTSDGANGQQSACDYAVVGSSNVTRQFTAVSPARSGADTYIEVGFTSAAGSVAAGGQSGEIQLRFNKDNWSNYNEANDYSCDPTKTSFANHTKVTLYRNGALVWGTEP